MINAGKARLNHDARKRMLNQSIKQHQQQESIAFHDALADPRHLEHLKRKGKE